MAHTKSTANPPPSSRNPPPQARRVAPGANPPPARNPPRASGAPSNQAERPTSSHANPAQATPPIAGGASLPPKDYKELYPWATSTLLKETSSINTELGVHRLRKGDQPDLSFHKEHDSKVAVLPCFPGEPVCADDKGSNGELFCFIYTTVFKKVKLRLPFTRFERELLTELNIAPAQLHPNSWAFIRAFQILCAHLLLPASVDVFLFLFEAKKPWRSPLGQSERDCWEIHLLNLPAVL